VHRAATRRPGYRGARGIGFDFFFSVFGAGGGEFGSLCSLGWGLGFCFGGFGLASAALVLHLVQVVEGAGEFTLEESFVADELGEAVVVGGVALEGQASGLVRSSSLNCWGMGLA
jgi:hypothetical protein